MLRVALIHDWLFGMRGGERCLESLLRLYPEAEVFSLFHRPEKITKLINERLRGTSSYSKLPRVESYYRYLLPLIPSATASLSRVIQRRHREAPFDVVISISHCGVKNVRLPNGVPHVAYCLTPMRYVWDLYGEYFGGRAIEPLARPVAKMLQRWDRSAAAPQTEFVGISEFVVERINRIYGKPAQVIYPPVRTDWIEPGKEGEVGKGFLCVSALVPYKNVAIVMEAFRQNRQQLTVIGNGPERASLDHLVGENVRLLPWVTDEELSQHYRSAKAMIFAAKEDFGMTPVEMQAAGRPVIALGEGGALETVVDEPGEESGIFYDKSSAESINSAVNLFLDREADFTVKNCVKSAERFSERRFFNDVSEAVGRALGPKAEKYQAAMAKGVLAVGNA